MITGLSALCYADVASIEDRDSFERDRLAYVAVGPAPPTVPNT